MENRLRLKLMRALTGLSQKEIADLMGVSENFVGNLEKGKRDIPEPRAKMLAQALHIDVEWLLGQDYPIVAEERFALFCVDGEKYTGPTKILTRTINAAAKLITENLKNLFPAAKGISYCYIGRENAESLIAFVVFNSHGLMFKVSNSATIANALEAAIRELKPESVSNDISVSNVFDLINYSVPEQLNNFIDRHNIGDDVKTDFKASVLKQCRIQADMLNESMVFGGRKTIEMATAEYVAEQRKKRIRRIYNEMVDHNISFRDIRKELTREERKKCFNVPVNDQSI